MPAKKTTRPTAAAPRSATPSATRPAAATAPRVRRAKAAAPAAADSTSKTPAATPTPVAAPQRAVTREDIQVRAYFLALENAGQGGSLDYWLAAERELLQGASTD